MLGLRDLVAREILPRWPEATVGFSTWKDDLATELGRRSAEGVRPLILVGHSYGGAALVRAVERLPAVRIDHLILLDPVPNWRWRQFQWRAWWLPDNVLAATCIYRPGLFLWSSPICGGCGRFENVWVRTRHAKIPGDPAVQARIVEIIQRELAS